MTGETRPQTAISKFSALAPDDFAGTIADGVTEFLEALGETRAAELYRVCSEYTRAELDFVFHAFLSEMSRLTFHGFSNLGIGKLHYTYQMLLTSAHAAPAAVAYQVDESQGIRKMLKIAGEIINIARADSLVVEMPDMERHDPVVLSGAVALTITRYNSRVDKELVQFMGEHWREMAAYREQIATLDIFDIRTATYLFGGGAPALMEGML